MLISHTASSSSSSSSRSSFSRCVGNVVAFGISSSISDLWTETSNGHDVYHVGPSADADQSLLRTVFLLSYWIFWGLLINAVIQGQIVDAFSSIRDEKRAAEDDLESRCFICSKERFDFDRYGHG